MRSQHWTAVCRTFEALSYLTKAADPNGIELVLTSNPTEKKKIGKDKTQKLVQFLKEQQTSVRTGACSMEQSLGTIFEDIKDGLRGTNSARRFSSFLPVSREPTQARGVNVYIFTNGVWEGGKEVQCGVEGPITTLIQQMQEVNKDRTYVALQFIQFGSDELGGERLNYLDNKLGQDLKL